MRVRFFAVFTMLLTSLLSASAQQKMELWYWHHSYLTSTTAVQASENLIDQAAAAGYTGLALWDSSINALNLAGWPSQNVAYLQQVIQYANSKGLKVVPSVTPYGHSGDVLRRNPNWAEGQRITGTQFQVDAAGQTLQVINSFPGLINGGFEAGKTGWFAYGDAGTVVDTSVSHTGLASGLINGALNSSGNARFYQQINVIPWRQYHLRMFLKTQNFAGFSQIQIFDSSNSAINKIDHSLGLAANQDWTQVDLTFNSGASSTLSILMGVWGGNSGSAWFDDISVEETALVYVLRRPGTPLKIYDPNNPATIYTEGTDYNPISDPKFATNPTFDNDNWHTPLTVTLPSGTRLRPGQVVTMDHYAVQPVYNEAVGMCLTDAGVQSWIADNAKSVAAVFPPAAGYFFGHDEMRHMNSCASCKAKNMTPGQLLAWSLGQNIGIFNNISPGAPIYIWSDMFDPYHNAHNNYYFVEGDIAGSWQGLPANVAVMNWNLNNLKNSATWFSGTDPKQPIPHRQMIAGFYDGGNAATLAQTELAQVSGIPGITGMMYTTWRDDYSQLQAFADAARQAWPAYQSSVAPVAVSISPAAATLAAGATLQFSATVTGTSNTAVTWAATAGTISSAGLFTAPSAGSNITVTATSVADGSKAGAATVTLQAGAALGAVYRVYAGTVAYTDGQGRVWSPDGAYAGPSAVVAGNAAIANTTSAPLYQNFRYNWANFGYHFPVANGSYTVRLLFAETQFTAQGERVFTVQLNGRNALTNFDVLAAAGGPGEAVDRVFPVTVTNGAIDLQLLQNVSNPMLSAVEITAPAVAVAPAQVTLGAGQTVQFSGPAGAAWSVQPALGSISAAGVYTAPAAVASAEQVTVTAAAGGQTASATVALAPAAGVFAPVRVNAGGGDLVDALGQVWAGDMGYTGGYFSATANAIGNTAFPALYQTQRWFYSTFQYQFAVPNGSRMVRLKFAETVLASAGQRWFNVAVNGAPALTNFDIAAQAGGANRAVDVDIPVTVGNGQISILITPVQGNAVINGIEILDASTSTAPAPVTVAVTPSSASVGQGGTQQFSAAVTGAADTSVTWSIAPAVGSIAASGLYTAPASATAAQTVTVTAASNASPGTTASASITLTPTSPVAVAVSPSAVSLGQGGTQQFSAAVSNTSNTAVTWSIAPAAGSITASGLYTAPASVTAAQTVTVTASSVADSSKSASATVTLNPPAPAAAAVYRVYWGAQPYTDAQGRTWNPDAAYATPSATAASGAALPTVYQGYRYNWTDLSYHFAVANGSYAVKLLFAETQYAGQGLRVFSVRLNGQNALTHFDVFAAGGANAAVDRVFPVTVTNGAIDLTLVQEVSNAMLSAIEITVPAVAVAPARAALSAGQSLQLSGPAGAAWSVYPALGGISAAGLYTAPVSIGSFEQVTVTAVSGGQSASATVALNPPAGAWAPLRVNAGGGDLVDSLGQAWTGDQGYTGGYFSSTANTIGNTAFPALYQSQRWFYAPLQYTFAVPGGAHTVRLKFAELQYSGAGQRWFNVTVNGQPALTNFDIAAQAGGANRAIDADIPVTVANGQVTIQITPVQGNAVINGIEIL